MNNLENVFSSENKQFAEELTELPNGAMKITTKGLARMLNISEATLIEDMEQGPFAKINTSDGITDEVIPHVVYLYANKGNKRATEMLMFFATKGVFSLI